MSKQHALNSILEKLSESQLELVMEITQALTKTVVCRADPTSDIAVPEFTENIKNRLLIHHATNEELLKKKPFEYAFKAACKAAGKYAEIIDSQTNPGADVIVDRIKFSLKSEASAKMNTGSVTISKLMEARWIRECKTNEQFAQETRERVGKHLREYQRILMLRASIVDGKGITYELVELPREILLKVEQVQASDFAVRTKNGSNSATIFHRGSEAFTIRLDGSVEKVTITRLPKLLCRHHATWVLPERTA
jgi:hypothetical protein